MFRSARLLIAAFGVLIVTGSAWAQPLGSFRWQQQPYCNILTLNVIGEGGNYTLDGTDDLCGATQKASVTGIAYQNPDGSIGFGLTIVGPPGGAVHVTASINLVTLGGTWSDSNGNTGLLVFTPGAGVPGSRRGAGEPAEHSWCRRLHRMGRASFDVRGGDHRRVQRHRRHADSVHRLESLRPR
jgi:hypothetical protein